MMPAGCFKNTDIFASILNNLMLPISMKISNSKVCLISLAKPYRQSWLSNQLHKGDFSIEQWLGWGLPLAFPTVFKIKNNISQLLHINCHSAMAPYMTLLIMQFSAKKIAVEVGLAEQLVYSCQRTTILKQIITFLFFVFCFCACFDHSDSSVEFQ